MPSKFNCAPKFDQKVKIPTREQVKDVCDKFALPKIDQIFDVKEFVKILGKFIADKFSVNVLHATAIEVDPGDININAYYDFQEDEFCKIAIELVLITNVQEKYLLFTEELYTTFVKRLADALVHELVHMKQSRARDHLAVEFMPDNIDDLDAEIREFFYLSNPDEIDAYAYNIADELKDNPDPLQKLRNPLNVTIDESINLWVYVNTFDGDLSDPILKKLLKKVYKRLT